MPPTERKQQVDFIRADEKRLRKLALEKFSVSLMNSTKWRELVDAISSMEIYEIRVKFIDNEKVWETSWITSSSRSYLDSGAFGPMLFVAIEWLEIVIAKAKNSLSEDDKAAIHELRRRLKTSHIPFREDSEVIRIDGYLRG